jgi:reverse transcriptase-like protein
MAYRVSQSSLELAVRHLARYGDTDIFPHLPELAFLTDEEKAVVQELAKLDLDSYMPAGAIEALAPKARYSFRIAHQLSALDTLLLLACVIEIGDKIEGKRQPVPQIRSFSYRFSPDSSVGQLFRKDRTYKDWLHGQLNLLSGNPKITHVLSTDISDYYSRINFHRLDNLLDEVASKHGASRFIKKHISVIRAKQSFGLPVGGSAARLLAELALADTDQALRDQGLRTTRFVDDFRIFLTANDHPYDALGFLAEQLGINEGLSLNSAKTEVIERDAYIVYLETATSDLEEEAEGVALDALTTGLYFDGEPDHDDLEKP